MIVNVMLVEIELYESYWSFI